MLQLDFQDYWQRSRRYESLVHWSPVEKTEEISCLPEIIGHYDLFLLDSDGLLLLDGELIPTAVEAINLIRRKDKKLCVVSNGGVVSIEDRYQKYQKNGLDIHRNELISAYEAVCHHILESDIKTWGLLSDEWKPIFDHLPVKHAQSDFDQFGGFLMYDCKQTWHSLSDELITSLQKNPRPVVVGNPDIGVLARNKNREIYIKPTPGVLASFLEDNGVEVQRLGKPFSPIYDLVKKGFPDVAPHRVLMMGDTLQTDILGGLSNGYHTMLVNSGMYSLDDIRARIDESGIRPHYLAPAI